MWTVLKRIVLILCAIVALFIGVVTIDVYLYARRDETRPAEAAIVLGAAVFGKRPSPVLRERINQAISLYEDGYVNVVIFTGGQGRPGQLAESEVARRYALEQGLPEEAILIETDSTTTISNLANAQMLGTEHHLDSFLIVSTPSHMRRAMAITDDLGMEAYSSPTRTIKWISWYTRSRAFWREVAAFALYLPYTLLVLPS